MGWRSKRNATDEETRQVPRPAVRVLRDPAELAAANQRAADGERRLRERLEARAQRDALMARREVGDRSRTIPWPESLKAREAAKAVATSQMVARSKDRMPSRPAEAPSKERSTSQPPRSPAA